ncbi:MAG: hypothetical protein JOZ75_05595 [Candidatus Dormibacteraeota bacterium]|nr:hypothetical protein [Candidatus Dormibacteraeota bacterium]
MSPTAPRPPEFFIDRSLGRHQIAEELRARGWSVRTMSEVYGEEDAQRKEDPPWLRDCGEGGLVVLTKDKAILTPQPGGQPSPQIIAIQEAQTQVFLLMSQSLSATEQAERFLRHERVIANVVSSRVGPFVYGIFADAMREVWPHRSDTRHRPEGRARSAGRHQRRRP